MNNMVQVPFHGDTLLAVKDEQGQVWVALKRMCEALGMAFEPQFTKLKNKRWAGITMIVTPDAKGVEQRTFCLNLDSVPMWLATIDTNRVAPDVASKLEQYQLECARVLRDHFFAKTGGHQARIVESNERIGHLESTIENLKLAMNAISRQLGDLASGRCSREALSAIRSTVATAADRYFESGMFKSLRQARSKFNQQVLAACGWQGRLDDLPAHLVPRANLECSRIIAGLRQLTAQRQTKLKLN